MYAACEVPPEHVGRAFVACPTAGVNHILALVGEVTGPIGSVTLPGSVPYESPVAWYPDRIVKTYVPRKKFISALKNDLRHGLATQCDIRAVYGVEEFLR